MQCFVTLSLGNALYLIHASPLIKETYEDILKNNIEVMNELCVLFQAYLCMCILFAENIDKNYIINEFLTAGIRGQLLINFIFILRSISIGIKDKTKFKLMQKYGMVFSELKKKRYGNYSKLSDEEVEILREKYEAKQAARKAKREAKEKAKRRAKNGEEDSESSEEAPRIALPGALSEQVNADKENEDDNANDSLQFDFTSPAARGEATGRTANTHDLLLDIPTTEVAYSPDRRNSQSSNKLPLLIVEDEDEKSQERQDIAALLSGVVSVALDQLE